MTWDDVRYEAKHVATQLQWDGHSTPAPLFLERVVRKAFRLPIPQASHTEALAARPVMVVPTRWVGTGTDTRTQGWAIRLTDAGELQYLRFIADGPPDWEAGFPFRLPALHGLTAGDHWAAVDNSQLAKTDLDWSWQQQVRRDDGVVEYAVSPMASPVPRGSTIMAALAELRQGAVAHAADRAGTVINLRASFPVRSVSGTRV